MPGRQEQTGDAPTSLHCEKGPQGLGTQGLTGSFDTGAKHAKSLYL